MTITVEEILRSEAVANGTLNVEDYANLASFPASGRQETIYIALDNQRFYRWNGSAYVALVNDSATWGSIAGTLSGQTDLQNALNAKQSLSEKGQVNGYASIDGSGTIPLSEIPVGAVNTVDSVAGKTGDVTLNKNDVGLSNVDNTSDANKPISTSTQAALDLKIDLSQKGASNGVATLNGSGLIPAIQLPSFVDDVLEFADLASFPVTGETGKIYVALDTSFTYRWGGSSYILLENGAAIWGNIGGTLADQTDLQAALDAKQSTNQKGLADGYASLDGSGTVPLAQIPAGAVNTVDSVAGKTGAVTLVKADVGLANVDNTSDADKPVSTAQQAALDLKQNLSEKSQVNGYASLDGSGTVPLAELPAGAINTVDSVAGKTGAVTLDKSDVGLANVDNTSDLDKPVSTAQQTALDLKQSLSEKGQANGYAPLNGSAKIADSFLNDTVFDVLQFANQGAFPATGATNTIYIAADTNFLYRWTGSVYAQVGGGGASGYELVEITASQNLTDSTYENVIFFVNSVSDVTLTINQNTTFSNCKFFKPNATLFWSSSFTTTFQGCQFNILSDFNLGSSFNNIFRSCSFHISSTLNISNTTMERCSIVANSIVGSGELSIYGTHISANNFIVSNSITIRFWFGSNITVNNFICSASPIINLNYSKLHIGKTTGNGAMSATLQYASEMKIRSAQTHFSTLIVDDTTNDATHLWIGEYKDTTVSTVNKLSNNDVITTLDQSQNIKGYEFIGDEQIGGLKASGYEIRIVSGTVTFNTSEILENICFYAPDGGGITFDLSSGNKFINCIFYSDGNLIVNGNANSDHNFEGCEFKSRNGGATFNFPNRNLFFYASSLKFGNSRVVSFTGNSVFMYSTNLTLDTLTFATTQLNQMSNTEWNINSLNFTNVSQASNSFFLQNCHLSITNINDSNIPLIMRNSVGQLVCNTFSTLNSGTYIRSENRGVSRFLKIQNNAPSGHGCVQVTEFDASAGEVYVGQVRNNNIAIDDTNGNPIYTMVAERDYGVGFVGLQNISAPMTGTYTPTITGNNGFTVGDTIEPATWVKIGNKVRVTGNFRKWSTTSDGFCRISISLPFATTTIPGDGNASISATSINDTATTTTSGVWSANVSFNSSTTIGLVIASQAGVQYASFDFNYTQTD